MMTSGVQGDEGVAGLGAESEIQPLPETVPASMLLLVRERGMV
jgi:hypothetical protein